MEIPFRTGEIVWDAHFAGRRAEVIRIQQGMWSRSRLLVTGARRQGKRSAVQQAFRPLQRRGGILLRVDLWTTEHLSEVLRRLVVEVPHDWGPRSRLLDFLRSAGLRPEGSGSPERAGAGTPAGRIRLGIRSRMLRPGEARAQVALLLRWLDGVAAHQPVPVVIALDEVQRMGEIPKGGFGLLAEWLAATRNLAWILSGSAAASLIPLTEEGGPLAATGHVGLGPIPEEELAPWIEKRVRAHGVEPELGVGRTILERAGPRTGDRLRLARAAYLRGLNRNRLGTPEVEGAFRDLVREGAGAHEQLWQEFPPYQRAVIRAVAAGVEQLHGKDAAFEFDLPVSSAVSKGVRILREKGHFSEDTPTTLTDPFFCGWVLRSAMPEGGG